MEQVERSLPFFCALPEMEWLDPRLIARCQSEADAFMLCWAKRRVRYSLRHAAAWLEIPASHLSNILSGKKYPSWGLRGRFQRLCGNWAIRQWEDASEGLTTLVESPEQRRIRELENEVGRLKGRAA